VAGLAAGGLLAIPGGSPAGAAPLPDLEVTVGAPSAVYVGDPFTETYTITNVGGAAADDPVLDVLTLEDAASTTSKTMVCHDTGAPGHTGYQCARRRGNHLDAHHSLVVVAAFDLEVTGTETQRLSALTTSSQANQVPHTANDVISPVLPPPPSTPSVVKVTAPRGRLTVTIDPGTTSVPGLPINSALVAVPVAGGTTIGGAVVTSAPGPVKVHLDGEAPATTYSATVVSSDAAGSTTSVPYLFTTKA